MTTLECNLREHTDTVRWTIPVFILSQKQDNQIQVSCSNTEIGGVEHLNYKLKAEIISSQKLIKIYFLSHITMNVKTDLTIVNPPQDVHQSEYSIVNAYEWQYLTTIDNIFNTDNVVLKFTFATKDVLQEELRDNFEVLLYNELYSDAVMKSSDGVEYKVHKSILATRSSVLKAHFTYNTTESITNIIESPFESDVLFKVLKFIYSNRVPKIYEMPEKLSAAADFYHLNSLKELCVHALCNNLTVENVIENLQLAELYSMEGLKKAILKFIMCNNMAHDITKTEAWTKFTSVTLIKFLYENVTKNL